MKRKTKIMIDYYIYNNIQLSLEILDYIYSHSLKVHERAIYMKLFVHRACVFVVVVASNTVRTMFALYTHTGKRRGEKKRE